MDTLASVVLAEELGRSTFTGVSYTVLDHTDMASVHVFKSGSEAQKDKWMPRIISGEVITAVAVTEPDAGSDVKGIRTFARRDGDSYVIDGTEMFGAVHRASRCGRKSRGRPCGEDIPKITEPKAKALFETTAEVLKGFITAYHHYEKAEEPGRRR